MALHMAMSYNLQVAQMNEEPPLKSSLNLTLTQHPHDENPELRMKVVTKLKTLLFSHGLQFPMLSIIVGYVVQFVDCLRITRQTI
jgi:hypothetical protein